jgi:Histidine kinase
MYHKFIRNLLNLKTMNQPKDIQKSKLPSAKWIQVGVWFLFLLFLSLYTIQKWDDMIFGIYNALIAALSYLIAVYANAYWLLPAYYKEKKKYRYYLYSLVFLDVLITVRMFAEYKLLYPLHKTFYNFSLSHFAFDVITILVAFAFGALLYISLNYISLLQEQEAMKRQQVAAELELLKTQVQPHFLFNTLNNIYYLAYTKDNKTAGVVAKLSDIMRYFVDEATKEKVPLHTELKFITNYMELEQIRMLHPAKIKFTVEANENRQLPPMLLITLIENIFKHGIDKLKAENKAFIELKEKEGYLHLKTTNGYTEKNKTTLTGKGLINLRKRLTLVYKDDFSLHVKNLDNQFIAELKFPLV